MKQILITLAWIAMFAATLRAQSTTYTQLVGADTFVSSGATNVNFGTVGAMEIAAPTAAQPRTLLTLLRFDTSGLQASFDADYGSGNWVVTGITLSLFSNFPTAGQQPGNSNFNKIAAGGFEFDLLGNNSWDEVGITWNTLPSLLPGNNNSNTLTPLGTFFWDAAGQHSSTWTLNSDFNLQQKIVNGELVTLLGQPVAGSTASYLFNSRSLNPGFLSVTAEAVPEPPSAALLAGFLCVAGSLKFFRRG